MLLENMGLGIAVGLFSLLVASIWDIKTREVPDWLSFSLMFFAGGYAAFLSIYHANAWFLINSGLGMLIGLGIGLFMFYTGQWGGGDSKLMIGICGIFGFALPGISKLHSNHEVFLFFINTIFVGAIYGTIYSLWKAGADFQECRAEAQKKLMTKNFSIARISLLALILASFVFYIVNRSYESGLLIGVTVSATLLFYVWVLISCVEKVCMIKEAPLSEVTEGDWVIKPVSKGTKTIYSPNKTGISQDDLDMLKKNGIKKVTVKIGMPFVPSFLLAYIVALVFENWIMLLLI